VTRAASERTANDAFRRSFDGGRVVICGQLAARADLAEILRKIREAEGDEAGDVFGNHAFGTVSHAGHQICWEIANHLSIEDGGFCRVLTILLAEDY
jgi:hypothetical protein